MFVHLVCITEAYGVKYLYHFVAKSYENVKKHRSVIEDNYYLKQHPDDYEIRIITNRAKDFEKIKAKAPEFQNTLTVNDLDEFVFEAQRKNDK